MQDRGRTISEILLPCKVKSADMVFSNFVYFNRDSMFPPPISHLARNYVTIKGVILCYDLSNDIPKGNVGTSTKLRQSLTLNLVNELHIKYYERKPSDKPATLVSMRVNLLLPEKDKKQIDDIKLGEFMKLKYLDFYVSRNLTFTVEFGKDGLGLTVDEIKGGGQNGGAYIGQNTKFQFTASSEFKIRLKSAKEVTKNVFAQGFTIQSLGIGGLDKELTSIFRRAFASRRLPLSVIDKFGINHVKGILLYGPPGTGKTLIARQLAKALRAKTTQVINGPEVFSKFVGESAENVRKLFKPAKDDMKKFGDQSPMHVLIFDEIDAICRKRGSSGDSGTSYKDDVVNQLLTNLDGVQALNNIVVVGMTNRKDLIDPAILRPGRLEVHINIGLPDEEGRKQILQIHTARLKKQQLLNKDVNLKELAAVTKNYTGAELQAVVKNASSYAMMKGNDIMDFGKQMKLQKGVTVTNSDFRKAIAQIVPGFGLDQQNFEILNRNPLIPFGSRFQKIQASLRKIEKLAINGTNRITCALLYGENGTGKTSIAAHFAMNSSFTFVKIISAERFIGVQTLGKINAINKTFLDAYKSKDSLIVIDGVERLIQYVKVGKSVDYSNIMVQNLLTLLIKKPTNPQCKLLVVGTTSNYECLELFDIDKAFGLKVRVPLLDRHECHKILEHDIKIEDIPIKLLTEFKESVRGIPKQMWKAKWMNFQQ